MDISLEGFQKICKLLNFQKANHSAENSGNSRLKIKLSGNFQEECYKNWVYPRRFFLELLIVIHNFLIKLTRVPTRPYTIVKLMLLKSFKNSSFHQSTASPSFSIQHQFFCELGIQGGDDGNAYSKMNEYLLTLLINKDLANRLSINTCYS